MNKRLLTIPIIFLLAFALLYAIQPHYSTLIVYAGGTPDSYGNRIVCVYIAEWNSTSGAYEFPYGPINTAYVSDTNIQGSKWVFPDTLNQPGVTLIEYTSSFMFRVYDNHPLKIIVGVNINKTLTTTPSSATRVYLNITGVVTNQLMTLQGNWTGTYFYLCLYYYIWNVTGQPYAGKEYNVAIRYEAYY
jgi:hypothetical protein